MLLPRNTYLSAPNLTSRLHHLSYWALRQFKQSTPNRHRSQRIDPVIPAVRFPRSVSVFQLLVASGSPSIVSLIIFFQSFEVSNTETAIVRYLLRRLRVVDQVHLDRNRKGATFVRVPPRRSTLIAALMGLVDVLYQYTLQDGSAVTDRQSSAFTIRFV